MKDLRFHLNRKLWVTAVMLLAAMLPALAQKVTVRGNVVDETGEVLIGASIMEKGTTNGTATDFDGNFELSVSANATLTISYVGFASQDVPVGGRSFINVVLSENDNMLDDVVVIGYGSVKKKDATGSVALVTPDEIDANISTSAQDLLTGASPGVVVTTTGGSPEGGATIRIRGGASLNASNDPLIVLNGVPLTNETINGMANPLAMISPDNIESMTILKDASATAIYGSRASNGVIIITTKKGKSGRPQINFSANVTVNNARKTWDVLNASEFASIIRERWGEDSAAAKALGNGDTDWQKEVLRTSVSHEYNLSVGGTAGFLPYRISGSYTDNNGILKDSRMQRVTAGFNLTPEFFGGLLKVYANANGYYIRNQFTNEDCTGLAVDADPTQPIYSNISSGLESYPYLYNGYNSWLLGYKWNTQGTLNPVAAATDKENIGSVYRSNGNLQIDYAFHFLPDLHANLNLGYDVSKGENRIDNPANAPSTWNSYNNDGAGMYYYRYELRRNTLLDFYLNYKKDVDAIQSSFDIMAGYSWQRFDSHGRNNASVYTTPGFIVTDDGKLLVDETTVDRVGRRFNDNPEYFWNDGVLQLVSFFGRFNYSFKDTYLLTFTLRDDGTSRFSKDNRWGLFPSLALGWKILNMPFMENARNNMNEFKLRLGWGQTGQQAVGGLFDYMPTFKASEPGSYYPNVWNGQNGSQYGITYYPNGYNPDLKWETTTTWNVGLDMAWWNNRLTVALDWYLRDSKDLLARVTVSPGAATTNVLTKNIGKLRNMGLEATIGAKPIMTDDFTWSTTYNIAWNKNKITDLVNGQIMEVSESGMGSTGMKCQVHTVGKPANSFYLYEQVYDEMGKPIEGAYVDQNGDGEINNEDRVIKHSKDPKVTMSWNNTFSWKNWDLGFSLRANIGNYVYNNVRAKRTFISNTYGNSTLRNLVHNDGVYFENQQYLSDYYLENAGFVRCDNITLGYTWNNLFNNNLRIRVYGAVQNPFVITRYKGIDPEVFNGVDNSTYPRPTSYTLGLIVTF